MLHHRLVSAAHAVSSAHAMPLMPGGGTAQVGGGEEELLLTQPFVLYASCTHPHGLRLQNVHVTTLSHHQRCQETMLPPSHHKRSPELAKHPAQLLWSHRGSSCHCMIPPPVWCNNETPFLRPVHFTHSRVPNAWNATCQAGACCRTATPPPTANPLTCTPRHARPQCGRNGQHSEAASNAGTRHCPTLRPVSRRRSPVIPSSSHGSHSVLKSSVTRPR